MFLAAFQKIFIAFSFHVLSCFSAAGLKCNVVTGISKNSAYELGAPLKRDELKAQWNVVKINGQWRPCDVLWASSFVKTRKSRKWALLNDDGKSEQIWLEEQNDNNNAVNDADNDDDDDARSVDDGNIHTFNEFYFLTDPDMLICTHLPNDPHWQMLREPFTEEFFEKYAYLRERFFELEMYMVERSHERCLLRTREGQVRLVFGLKEETAEAMHFRYNLYRWKKKQTRQKPDDLDEMMKQLDENENNPNPEQQEESTVPLNEYVFCTQNEQTLEYTIKFPVTGKFRLDVFGRNREEDDSFELVCAYIILCPMAVPKEDDPVIPYDPFVELRFPCETDSYKVLQEMRANEMDKMLWKRNTIVKQDGSDVVFYVKLPPESKQEFLEYAHEPRPYGEETTQVYKYLERVMEPGVYQQPYPDLHGGVLGKTYLADELKVEYKPEEKETDDADDLMNDLDAEMGNKQNSGDVNDGKVLRIKDGQMKLRFAVPDDVELLCQITHKSVPSEKLADSVQTQIDGDEHTYQVDFPAKGEYGFNIFARYKDDKDRVYHVYTCMADYDCQVEDSYDRIENPDLNNVDTQEEETNIE